MNHDVEETIEQVVISSRLPISIIIVGIGDANFDNMEVLDADKKCLHSSISGTSSQRDNVQFVEFNTFKDNPHLLAQETLKEVPRQMVDYFKKLNISPKNMRQSQINMEARDFFSKRGN
jgi:hypothetical protein